MPSFVSRAAAPAVAAVVLGALLVSSPPAGATPAPELEIGRLCRGSTSAVVGYDFAPRTSYTLTATGGTVTPAQLTTDDAGDLDATIMVDPATAPGPGIHLEVRATAAPDAVAAEVTGTVLGPRIAITAPVGADLGVARTGDPMTVAGSCFAPERAVTFTSDQIRVSPAGLSTTATGTFTATLTLDAVLHGGTGYLEATETDTGLSGRTSPGFCLGADRLSAGQTLTSYDHGCLVSPSGGYRLFMVGGPLVVYRYAADPAPGQARYTRVWASGVSEKGYPYTTLQFDPAGYVELAGGSSGSLWTSGPARAGIGRLLTLQDDGNLVLRTATGTVVWSSAHGIAPPRTLPTQLVGTGSIQSTDQQLGTANGYRLTVQPDGNLVLRNRSGVAIWTSHSPIGRTGARLDLQDDGNLVVRLTYLSRFAWTSHTGGHGDHARLTLQTDGNVVLRDAAGRAYWATNTAGR